VKIKAYHGSNHEITKFSDEFAGGPKSIDAEGPGIYLTNSRENAEMWGKYTYELILSPRKFITNQKPSSKANRIDMKKFLDMKGDEDYANNWSPDIETDKLMAINEAIKYNETEDEAWHSLRREQYNGVPQAFMRAMSKLGYDMMTLKKDFDFGDVDATYHYIVYNPEIIEIVGAERNSIEENAKKAVRKLIREVIDENINNISEFKIGKCYQCFELPQNVFEDIYAQFSSGENDPEDYKYCFKLLEPKEIPKYLPLVNTYIKEYKKGDKNYLESIINSIKKQGLKYPAVGTEGNHRGAIFYLLNKPLPYLEIKSK